MKTTKLSKKKVKIRNRQGKHAVFWKVISPKLGGGSIRRFFKDEAEADIHMELQQIQITNHGAAGASMNEKLRGAALRAQEILEPLGLDLVTAAKFYADHISSRKGGIPLSKAVELLKKSREGDAYSEIYRKSLTHRLKHFVAAFPEKSTTEISKAEIATFLQEKCKTSETRKSYRRTIKTLYSYLIENQNHTIDPVPEQEKGKAVKESKWSVEILTPQECSRLLHSADEATLPSLAIGMFCGLRASEIERLDWKKINLTEKQIVIDSSVAKKTGSRRVVPIPEACVQWLTPYAKESGPVHPQKFLDLFDTVRIEAGFRPSNTRLHRRLEKQRKEANPKSRPLTPWPSNCLRHTAISYALAESRDESKVASWAGNSPAMIKKHYDSQAMPSGAKAFYSILPQMPHNVIGIKRKAKVA